MQKHYSMGQIDSVYSEKVSFEVFSMREQISTHKPPQFNYNSETYNADSDHSGFRAGSMMEGFVSEKEMELMEKIEAIDRQYKDSEWFRNGTSDSVSSLSGKSRDLGGSENLVFSENFESGQSGDQKESLVEILDGQENLTEGR